MHAGSQVLGSWIGVLAAERRHKNHVDQLSVIGLSYKLIVRILLLSVRVESKANAGHGNGMER